MKPVSATDVAPRAKRSNYPAPFAQRVEGRQKRALGDHFGLAGFGVNLTTLEPGAISALHHVHGVQDEFIYVLTGHPTLYLDDVAVPMGPGMVMGFPAGGAAHHLCNETDSLVTYLEVGDRRPGDTARYPADDLAADFVDGRWQFTRKDGTPY